MKKLLLTIFVLIIAINSFSQTVKDSSIILEKEYKEHKNLHKIKGRVNRNVLPQQTNTYVIEYDFKTGVYSRNMLNLKVNTPVVFKIININRLAYDIKVAPRDSIIADTGWENGVKEFLDETPLPTVATAKEESNVKTNSEVKAIESNDAKSSVKDTVQRNKMVRSLNEILYNIELGLDVLHNRIKSNDITKAKLNQELLEINSKNQKGQKILDSLMQEANLKKNTIANYRNDSIDSKRKYYEKEFPLIDEYLKSLNRDDSIFKVNSKLELKSIMNEIEKNDTIINRDKAELKRKTDLKKNIDTNYKRLAVEYENFTVTFAKLKRLYFKILKVNECYNEVRIDMSNPLLFSSKQIDLIKLEKLKSTFPSLSDDYSEFLSVYMHLGHELYVLKQDDIFKYLNFGGQIKFLEPATNMKSLADDWHNEIKKTDVTTLIHEMKRALELLINPEVYTYISKPIQPVKDIVIFDVKIKKHNQDKPHYNNDKDFSYKEYTKGGMRFDAGIGFAISYFDNAPQYEITPNEEEKNSITIKEKNLWVPSFVGIFTASFRSNKLATFGISAGIGISANDGKFEFNNFYFGPSLTLGREDRFCLTSGFTVKSISKLKANVKENTLVSNTNDISSFTNEAYKFGPFLSLTYNLTKGIRNNVKYFSKK